MAPTEFPSVLISVLMGITAVILGLVAISRIRNHPQLAGRGMAIAGLVGGGLIVLLAAWLVLGVVTGRS